MRLTRPYSIQMISKKLFTVPKKSNFIVWFYNLVTKIFEHWKIYHAIKLIVYFSVIDHCKFQFVRSIDVLIIYHIDSWKYICISLFLLFNIPETVFQDLYLTEINKLFSMVTCFLLHFISKWYSSNKINDTCYSITWNNILPN